MAGKFKQNTVGKDSSKSYFNVKSIVLIKGTTYTCILSINYFERKIIISNLQNIHIQIILAILVKTK